MLDPISIFSDHVKLIATKLRQPTGPVPGPVPGPGRPAVLIQYQSGPPMHRTWHGARIHSLGLPTLPQHKHHCNLPTRSPISPKRYLALLNDHPAREFTLRGSCLQGLGRCARPPCQGILHPLTRASFAQNSLQTLGCSAPSLLQAHSAVAGEDSRHASARTGRRCPGRRHLAGIGVEQSCRK